MNEDLIIKLFRYFSGFVPLTVLKDIIIQPEKSQLPGYAEIQAEILADAQSGMRISYIEKFVLSINEKFVSERIKNSKGFILFVEYGNITVDFLRQKGVNQSLAVTVVRNLSDSNSDNLNEALLMNRCLEILTLILNQMIAEQGQIDFCPMSEIQMPVDIQVVDPASFYGCGGWSAIFQNAQTILA
jgi:hypothetical protein